MYVPKQIAKIHWSEGAPIYKCPYHHSRTEYDVNKAREHTVRKVRQFETSISPLMHSIYFGLAGKSRVSSAGHPPSPGSPQHSQTQFPWQRVLSTLVYHALSPLTASPFARYPARRKTTKGVGKNVRSCADNEFARSILRREHAMGRTQKEGLRGLGLRSAA